MMTTNDKEQELKKRRPEKGFLNNSGKNDVGLDHVVEDKGWKQAKTLDVVWK